MNPLAVGGTIVFYEDDKKVGEENLLRGNAAINYAPQSAGTKKITAEFIPDTAIEPRYNRAYGNAEIQVKGADTVVTISRSATFTTSFESGSRKLRAVFTPADTSRWTTSEGEKSITVAGAGTTVPTSVKITAPDKAFTNEPVQIKASA